MRAYSRPKLHDLGKVTGNVVGPKDLPKDLRGSVKTQGPCKLRTQHPSTATGDRYVAYSPVSKAATGCSCAPTDARQQDAATAQAAQDHRNNALALHTHITNASNIGYPNTAFG